MEGGKRSAWMTHVKKTMKSHKGMKLGAALKLASKTFKKRGGAEGVEPYDPASSAPAGSSAAVGGRRRKTRRSGRKSSKRSRKH